MTTERPRLVVWSRTGCGLCDEMVEELRPWLAARGLDAQLRDVDDDPEARRRFGLKVPVLTLDGEIVCHGRLDAEVLDRLLRPGA